MEEIATKVKLAHDVIEELEQALAEEHEKVNALRGTLSNIIIIVKNSRHRNLVIEHAAKALAESEPGYANLSRMDQARMRFYYHNLQRPD